MYFFDHLKNTLSILSEHSGIDFDQFRTGFLRRKLCLFATANNYSEMLAFDEALINSKTLIDRAINFIFPSERELFRDADLWNFLHGNLLPELLYKKHNLQVYFPLFLNNADLSSFLFLLNFMPRPESVQITISSLCPQIKLNCEEFSFNKKELKLFEKHTEQLDFTSPKDIFSEQQALARLNIYFQPQITIEESSEKQNQQFDLIFMRNKLLLLTPSAQRLFLEDLNKKLYPGKYLIIGEKERLSGESQKKYTKTTSSLNIHKKL